MRISVLLLMVVAVLLVLGCASSAPPVEQVAIVQQPTTFVQQPATVEETNVTVAALQTSIVDWTGRMAGSPSRPEWLQDIALQNWDGAARRLGYPAGGQGAPIYRGLIIHGPDLRGAQMRATAAFSRDIARELQSNIRAHLASDANSMSGPTTEAFGEQVSVLSEVTLSGAQILREFWHIVDITENNRTRRETVLYRLYRIDASDWAAITGGYMQMVLDRLPQRYQPEERQVREMLQHTLNQSRAHEELTLQQLQNQLDAQQRMIDAQIALMPAEQRSGAAIELARIHAETERTTVQARTTAETERAAFASHDPAVRAAANTLVLDAPMVSARRVAQAILF